MAIYRSPHPPFDIPDVALADFVLARAAERGERAALVDGATGRTITYAQLPGMVDRAAAALARRGLKKGDVCAIYSPNAPEYAIAVLAITRLGAIVTTASPMYTRDDLVKQLKDSRACFLITSPAVAGIALDAAAAANVEHILSFGPTSLLRSFVEAGPTSPHQSSVKAGAMRDVTSFDELLAEPGTPPAVTIHPSDVVALPYSSGTTGLPKGVMLSHRNIIVNILQIDSAGHLRDGADTLVCFLPFFHIYGLVVTMLLGLWSGATLVVMSRFELEQYLDLVERYRATVLHVVPPVVLALAKSPAVSGRDFSHVRKLFSGAAPLGADVIAQCIARVGCVMQQGYGMTEASPATHCTTVDPAMSNTGSIGVPVALTECRVVDPTTGADVPPGQDGELWIRGPQVMLGYFNRPEETRTTVDADGWLHTGDIGHVDQDGYFFVVDRLKELIKYKGMQIAPAELEGVLLSHPAVADAAVVAHRDEEAGEIPHAFIVLKTPATAAELMAFVAERVASYKKVRRLDFIDAIPKSPSGKILRRVLRDGPVPAG
jgi:acyl-CoA synthetase (AMP-forming)/AMP-acid ligase II